MKKLTFLSWKKLAGVLGAAWVLGLAPSTIVQTGVAATAAQTENQNAGTNSFFVGVYTFKYGLLNLPVDLGKEADVLLDFFRRISEDKGSIFYYAQEFLHAGHYETVLAVLDKAAHCFKLDGNQIDTWMVDSCMALTELGHPTLALKFAQETEARYRDNKELWTRDMPLGNWLGLRTEWLKCYQVEQSAPLRQAAQAKREYARIQEKIILEQSGGKPTPLWCYSVAQTWWETGLFLRAAGQWQGAVEAFRHTRLFTKAHLKEIREDRPSRVDDLLVPDKMIQECLEQEQRPNDPRLTLLRRVAYPMEIEPYYQATRNSIGIRLFAEVQAALRDASFDSLTRSEAQEFREWRDKTVPKVIAIARSKAASRAVTHAEYLAGHDKGREALAFSTDWLKDYGDDGFTAIAVHLEMAKLHQGRGEKTEALKCLALAEKAVPRLPEPELRDLWRSRVKTMMEDLRR